SKQYHESVDGPATSRQVIDESQLATFRELIRDYMPSLYPHPIRTQTYYEAYTETSTPLIERSEDNENLIIMTGFSGHGFKLATAYGEVAAQLALNEPLDRAAKFLLNSAVE